MVSLYYVKMYVPELKSSKVSAYVRWWPQMDAYGIYKEFGEVLKAKKHSKLPDKEMEYQSDGETEIDLSHTPEQKEMLVKNKMAVTAFTMAFRDNTDSFCMSLVLNSKTSDWPSGKTWEIVQELQDEFAPTDMMGEAEQQRELEAIHMKKHGNPKTLFSQITAIENKYRG